jgi:hypothetical protein
MQCFLALSITGLTALYMFVHAAVAHELVTAAIDTSHPRKSGTATVVAELSRPPPANIVRPTPQAPPTQSPRLPPGPPAQFKPVTITAAPMSIVGGALPAPAAAFAPKTITAAPMSIVGGALPVPAAAFTPVTITAPSMTITGN